MGYEIGNRTVKLTFDDVPHLAGLEVEVRLDVGSDLVFEMADVDPTDNKELQAVAARFLDNVVVGWNITREGKPVPISMECPPDLLTAIMKGWASIVNPGDTDPLDLPSAPLQQ